LIANENAVDKIVNAIVNTGVAQEIIVFGSYARGDNTDESDIDFCVLIDDVLPDNKTLVQVTADLHAEIWGIEKPPVDLLVYRRSNFYYRAGCSVTLEHVILKEGKRLHGLEQRSA
jgi:predicted nucleotidyltransferase